MQFELNYTKNADEQLKELKNDSSKKRILKDVLKALRLMESNLKHPSLNTHEFDDLKGPQGEKVFEAYAQQNTPGAYRIFWCYGPEKGMLNIIAIIPHPD
jgi:hypothetical protein